MEQKNKVLITGINGFVGSHLADYCLMQGDEVHGTIRNRSSLKNVEHILDKISLHECELTDSSNVDDLITEVEPEKIFHLAAQSYVPTSWKSPADTLMNNIIGQLNIFEAVRVTCPSCKIMITGSSEEYGNPIYTPIDEEHPLNPVSPYGVSKVTQDKLACQYVKSYGMKIVVTRAFNHTGPRRHENFVCASFAKQIADAVEEEEGAIIKVGNLEAIRDFTDVRDMVRAYYMALSCDKIRYGEPYNICSGAGIKIDNILGILVSISKKKIRIEKDPNRMRPSDLKELVGNCDKFNAATCWTPTIDFEQTLEDIYNYYNKKQ